MAAQSIQITWKQLFSAGFMLVITFIGGLWLVAEFTFGGIRSDVKEIRNDFKTLTKEDTTIRGLLSGTELGIRQDITNIKETVSSHTATLNSLSEDVRLIKTVVIKRF